MRDQNVGAKCSTIVAGLSEHFLAHQGMNIKDCGLIWATGKVERSIGCVGIRRESARREGSRREPQHSTFSALRRRSVLEDERKCGDNIEGL